MKGKRGGGRYGSERDNKYSDWISSEGAPEQSLQPISTPAKKFHQKMAKHIVSLDAVYCNSTHTTGRGLISGKTLITCLHVWKNEVVENFPDKTRKINYCTVRFSDGRSFTIQGEEFESLPIFRPDNDDLVYIDLSTVEDLPSEALPSLKKYLPPVKEVQEIARDAEHFEPLLQPVS